MYESMPADPFPDNVGEHPLLEVTNWGLKLGYKNFGDGIVKVTIIIQTVVGDFTVWADLDDAQNFGEGLVAQAAYVRQLFPPNSGLILP